jgi:uncharacterized membrane protein (UPF0127 family)
VDHRGAPWCVHVPVSRRERARGLRGRTTLDRHEALFLARCRSVQTFGMRFAIDALLLDEKLELVDVVTMRPGRVLRPRARGRHVLEVATGSKLRPGDRFRAGSNGARGSRPRRRR